MRRIFQLMVVTFLLVGCSSITSKKPVPVITIEPTEPTAQPTTPTSPDTVPQLPKVKKVVWSTAVVPLANQLVQAPGVESGKVLLIDSIKNNTNMSIQSMQATDAIINAVNNQNVFKLVPQDVVANARKALGLSQEDSLVTRSKAIGLARYVQADYVLYSVISGNQQQSEIEMQLMGAQTGEILWSGTNRIE